MATLHELVEELTKTSQSAQVSLTVELSSGHRVPLSLKGIEHTTNPVETTTIVMRFEQG